ncbi:DUF2111 domain-containing protein [Methanopyrus kandleri]|uniref:Uncharacterized protein conserved in archaea n=2 Tax=Methanopyrus kandleri TaxID=2320 RepID=Q8TXU0_METKA|nr:DUF2111 domain-containing protein [Methanopyrus kandleri]AAM01785.1 Uncharacterized protein conserved in archaea [Methanopyrus kandleri AV19]HII70209.1 DUF2111 domain-containing protein [Methanopyrus kandleri]
MRIRPDSTAEDILPLAMAVHELVNRLPVTMRTRDNPGVRIEDGEVIDDEYTGPVLEEVLEKGEVIRKVPESGPYEGTPVVVVPIKDEGETIAALGVVDLTYGIYSSLRKVTQRPIR